MPALTLGAAVLACSSLATPNESTVAPVATFPAAEDLIVEMTPCDLKRPRLTMFMSSASRRLALEGTVKVGNETFRVFLPSPKVGFSSVPRPRRKGILTTFTSTCLAVDQNHDGEISTWESYYAENPLRIGDSMFTVKAIDEDGTLTLAPSELPLTGPVIGRKAPDFSWTSVKGETLRRDDFLGRAVVIDCWAPS